MIPKDWSGISIEMWLKLKGTMEVEVKDDVHALDIGLEQYRILTGDEEADDSKVLMSDLEDIRNLLKSEMPRKVRDNFTLNGVRYKIRLNPEKVPTTDYVTIMNLAKKGDSFLHQVLFTICQPVKKGWYETKDKLLPKQYGWHEYDFEPWELEQRIKDFKGLTMDIVNPIRLFFLNVSIELTEITQAYLEKQAKKMMKELELVKEDLLTNMDG